MIKQYIIFYPTFYCDEIVTLQTILIFLRCGVRRGEKNSMFHKQAPQIDSAQIYTYQFSFKQ